MLCLYIAHRRDIWSSAIINIVNPASPPISTTTIVHWKIHQQNGWNCVCSTVYPASVWRHMYTMLLTSILSTSFWLKLIAMKYWEISFCSSFLKLWVLTVLSLQRIVMAAVYFKNALAILMGNIDSVCYLQSLPMLLSCPKIHLGTLPLSLSLSPSNNYWVLKSD